MTSGRCEEEGGSCAAAGCTGGAIEDPRGAGTVLVVTEPGGRWGTDRNGPFWSGQAAAEWMAKRRRGGSASTNSDGESYVVGQVANSLSCHQTAKDKTMPLMTLFPTPSVSTSQLLFTPILEHKVSGKEQKIADDKPAIGNKARHQILEQKEPVRRKELTAAEQKLAQRESALSAGDKEDKGARCMKRKWVKEQAEDGSWLAVEQPMKKAAKRFRKQVTPEMEKMKNERTLFVGNLPSDYTKQMITALFKEFGPIESVRLRSVASEEHGISKKLATIQRKVHPKRNNINAYVVFRQQSDAVKALARNGSKVQTGFHLRVDLANKSNVHDHRRSVFLGNLPFDIQENDVHDHFCGCGEIKGVRIVRDQESGMGKGFGYLLFQNTDAVTLALKLNDSELKGRRVRVSRSVKKERESQQPAADSQAERKKSVVKDFTGLMVTPVEGKKTKKKNQVKKKRRSKAIGRSASLKR
ncbi:RNA-binding protein 34 [Narcine bancroftii]|uniref:RNA-binding protein 34 n=1 Tax=Narcine bancroftii TaxID=1343680 RepID=UPI003831BB4E